MKIILIGFMGSGKSTISKKIAGKLNLKLIEMDTIIEQNAGKTIKDIFSQQGETTFRQMEIDFAKEYAQFDNIVISTGGGVVMNKIILDYFKDHNGKIFFLDTSFEEIVKRIGNDTSRPLFQDKIKAHELYKFRYPLYKSYADVTIHTIHKTQSDIVEEIIQMVR